MQLSLAQVNFLIELCSAKGVSVPITSAKLASETFEALLEEQRRLQDDAPRSKGNGMSADPDRKHP